MKHLISILSKWIFSSKRNRFLWGMTMIAFCIRLGIIVFAANPQHPEMYEHGSIAHNLYNGHGFAMHWPYDSQDPGRRELMKLPPQYESAYQPPLNPYLIYFAYKLFGETTNAAIFLMLCYTLASCAIPFVVYKTGLFIGSESAARISALIASFFLPAAFAVITFSGSALYQLVGILVVYFSVRSVQCPSIISFSLLGISSGIMTLLRSEFLALGFILIFVSLICLWKKYSLRKFFFYGSISICLSAVIIAPWAYRNYSLFSKFVPIVDRPWHEIWRGNNVYSTATTFDENGAPIWVNPVRFPEIVAKMDSIPYDQQFSIRTDSIFRSEAIGFIKQHPWQFAELGARKIFTLFTVAYSPGISSNPPYFICMIGIVILTFVGIVAGIKARHTHGGNVIFFYIIFFGFYCFISVLTFVLPRYQIYIFVVMLPLTGLGWEKLWSSFKKMGNMDSSNFLLQQ